MATDTPISPAHPVESNERQAHGHEYKTQHCETRSLKTQEEDIESPELAHSST